MFADLFGKLLAGTKTSYIPAAVFAAAFFYFCSALNFAPEQNVMWYVLFYVFCGINAAFLLFLQQTKTIFITIWLLIAGITLNNLKINYGIGFTTSPSWELLLILLPLNWLFFLIRDDIPLNNNNNFYCLCAVLFQTFLIEKAKYFMPDIPAYGVSLIGAEWIVVILVALIWHSCNNTIKNAGVTYALISIGFALFYADSPAAVAIFFAASSFILLSASLHAFLYGLLRDALTGVHSRTAYYRHAKSAFPLKYSLGVIYIDNYEKIRMVYGARKTDMLTKMIVNKIQEADTGAAIYRYNDDEFILIFKNENKKQGREYLENIRRSIAGSEFMLGRKPIKEVITISAGISEKKRSDADAEVVLTRTREKVQKAYKFTQNLTSEA